MNKNVIITILAILVLGLGGYLVYDKVLVKEEKNETNVEEKVEEVEEKVYTYKDVAGNYYYEQDAGVKEMPGLMDRFGLILSEDGTFSYSHTRDIPHSVIGNYIINGNIIALNYIGLTGSDVSLGIINDKTHTLIINEDKSITDEKVDLDTMFTSKITLVKDGLDKTRFESIFNSFDETLQQLLPDLIEFGGLYEYKF